MTSVIDRFADIVKSEGTNAWFKREVSDFISDDVCCCKCGKKDFKKTDDILDVWFDSGVTHACVLRERDNLRSPADLYLEGSDQHRGWFQSSLLTGIAAFGEAPYKNVLTHGFTVDKDGRKMSKSIGNILPAAKAMNDMGADILRLWVAATDYRGELTVDDEVFKRTADSYRRIRNTARFLLSNLDGFNPATDALDFEDMLSLDRWAIDRAMGLQGELRAAYDAFEFHVIYQKLHNFCSLDLGGFYLDVIKDRQYTTAAASKARRSAQTAMYHIAEALVRWMAPILSFTAEEIWENLPGDHGESVFLSLWYEGLSELPSDEAMGRDYWQRIMSVRTAVNKEMEAQRAAGVLRGSLDAEITLFCADELMQDLRALGEELRFVLITSEAKLAPMSAAHEAAETDIEGLRLSVSVSESEKCERCWHRRPEVGSIEAHPTLCERCVSNIEGEGEKRDYA